MNKNMYMASDAGKLGDLAVRYKEGIYLGMVLETSEKLIGTPEGIIKVRSINRCPEDRRWDVGEIEKIVGTPWKPYVNLEDDRLKARVPAPPEEAEPKEAVDKDLNMDPEPRGFMIQRSDLTKYGYTPDCPGCYAARNTKKHKRHTPICRDRVKELMANDPKEQHRVVGAHQKE